MDAGWSSLVARWAHNPKVGGSNPPPATNLFNYLQAIEKIKLRPTHIITHIFFRASERHPRLVQPNG
jgi:hypothetical protein